MEIADRALLQFWAQGYHATSMDDLVERTGTSRHAIYKAWAGKRQLYLACFPRYQEMVVSPGFERVEQPDSGLAQIQEYFHFQIDAAETSGMQGCGCFVANATTETAPHDVAVRELVAFHSNRLKTGFVRALARAAGRDADDPQVRHLAEVLVVFGTGLWAHSRVVDRAGHLKAIATTFVQSVERSLE